MSEEIINAEKYLSGRLAECGNRPDLHRHTIAVYNNYLKILKERPGDYAHEAGDRSLQHAVLRGKRISLMEYLGALRGLKRPAELMS